MVDHSPAYFFLITNQSRAYLNKHFRWEKKLQMILAWRHKSVRQHKLIVERWNLVWQGDTHYWKFMHVVGIIEHLNHSDLHFKTLLKMLQYYAFLRVSWGTLKSVND